MDRYLEVKNSIHRLISEYDQYGSLVICYDFDDTVYDFHKKGYQYEDVIALIRELKDIGCYLICWTGNESDFVKEYLVENNIPFDAINENPPFYKSSARKVYANAYLDDRAGLFQVYNELKTVVIHAKLIHKK